jgi:flagellar P-ring protein precursor FlgI
LSAGRITAGATVEREIATSLGQGEFVALELRESNFNTASRIVESINGRFGVGTASAQNGRVIYVRAPLSQDERVSFLGDLELMQVQSAPTQAKVVLNGRTGSIVMNQAVTIEPCAVAHGALSIVISAQSEVSQPNALSLGQTVVVESSQVEVKQETAQLVQVPGGALLSDVVKGLNALGVSPQDLLAILQAMKVAGALRAEIEVI